MDELKFCGTLLLHTFVALIGTAIVSSTLGRLYTPHSFDAALAKEWIFSALCAALLGFFVARMLRSSSAKWTWAIPMLWFCAGLLMALGTRESVISTDGGIVARFSGEGCSDGMRSVACRNFFLFTIPLARSIFYSIGALLSLRQEPSAPTGPADIDVPNLT